jgi:hypothetical protein
MEFFLVLDRMVRLSRSGRYETKLAQKYSPSLRDTPAYNEDDARMWVIYWCKHGLADFSE